MMKFWAGVLVGMGMLGIAQAEEFDPAELARAKCAIEKMTLQRRITELGEVVLYLHQDLQRAQSNGKRP